MVATLDEPTVAAGVSPASDNGSEETLKLRADNQVRRFLIGRDQLNKAIADLPGDQAEALEWFWRYCRDRNVGPDRLKNLLQKSNGDYYSRDSIYQALTGRRTD